MSLADRVVGSCLGLALGDALGAPFEVMRAHLIPDPVPAFELDWAGGPAGSTTDATSMARNLMRSLAERGELDPEDLVRRQVEWFRSDPPDVSTLTRLVLRRAARGENASTAAREIWERRGPEVSAGNGSVMYCAPLGVAHANRPDELFELAPALSALTHFDGRCKTAALAVTFCVAALVRGEDSEVASTSALRSVAEHEGGEELEFRIGKVLEHAPRTPWMDGSPRTNDLPLRGLLPGGRRRGIDHHGVLQLEQLVAVDERGRSRGDGVVRASPRHEVELADLPRGSFRCERLEERGDRIRGEGTSEELGLREQVRLFRLPAVRIYWSLIAT